MKGSFFYEDKSDSFNDINEYIGSIDIMRRFIFQKNIEKGWKMLMTQVRGQK